MNVLSDIEMKILAENGIIVKEWLGNGNSGNVFAIGPYMGESNLCIKYMRDVRKKTVEAEFKRDKTLYMKEPRRFMKVVKLLWIDVPDAEDPEQNHTCAVFVMERLQKIRKQKNSLRTIVKILYDITVCLSIMHILGFYHRDIKPDNILYCHRTGTYTLIDTGISAAAHGTFTDKLGRGTPNHIAPESLQGHYSNRSDIYSLGMTGRELFVGVEIEIPDNSELGGKSLSDYLYEEKEKLLPLDENAYGCPELIRVINKMTEFNREDRQRDYRELLIDLKGVVKSMNLHIADDVSPSSYCFIAVSANSRLSAQETRKLINENTKLFQKANSEVCVFSFDQKLFIRRVGDADNGVREVEIVCDDGKTGLIDSLTRHILRTAQDHGETVLPDVKICVIGADASVSGVFTVPLMHLKEALFRSRPSVSIAYRIVFADEYAVDVSDFGISEISVVNSPGDLTRCLDRWFIGGAA